MTLYTDNVHPDGRQDWKQKTMKSGRPLARTTLAILVAVPLLLGVLAGAIAGVMTAPPVAAASHPTTTDYVNLTIGFDFASGLDRYFPANFTVDAHAVVVITITNFDHGVNPVPAQLSSVKGTVGGTETIRDAANPTGTAVTSVPDNETAHTFTLLTGPYDVNVPIPAAKSASDPVSVTFSVVFDTPGVFQWHCMAPCDDVAMTTPGYMTGFVTVNGS